MHVIIFSLPSYFSFAEIAYHNITFLWLDRPKAKRKLLDTWPALFQGNTPRSGVILDGWNRWYFVCVAQLRCACTCVLRTTTIARKPTTTIHHHPWMPGRHNFLFQLFLQKSQKKNKKREAEAVQLDSSFLKKLVWGKRGIDGTEAAVVL